MTKIVRREDGTVLVERFSVFRRIEHLFVIATFVALCLTGFPQKYYAAGWSSALLKFFGGLDTARAVHRISGIIFSIHAVIHFAIIVMGILLGKMQLTLLPTSKDIHDIIHTLRYYFGKAKALPLYPKFHYRQKFEYIGLIFGGVVMIVSGLILLYPVLITHYLPGQLIPAARIAHSGEALLAFLVIIIWHLYGSHISPEVFPMDKTIFTGYMTKEELEEKHGLEHERVFGPKP
ncbi:MAG: cytochrome C [Deltaproteobacteria bacterium]|nr:cytochrome C [Deltaproteobacteria bacterium]